VNKLSIYPYVVANELITRWAGIADPWSFVAWYWCTRGSQVY